ncbi:MAG: phasin family domain-containing protein [Micavibrio aeruginosavorus]|uniref:Phasin family domain-containing protein n=1 Tax=Micavibrio aeruginosavorus TaxID=349221 RepID=A0A2W5MZP2_9BACT|nr:MAG: phasin family domain-containing protein [Micavibrio aeruginosavorus]
MAAKKKKTKSVAKKTTATVLKNSAKPVASTVAAFKGFPQFQPFKLETNMFKGNKQFEKIAQDAAVIGQDQVDALVKSSTIFAKGMEDILKTCMEIAQDAGEKSQSVAKTVMSCKTLNEFTDVQTRLAQSSFDDFMTNATTISEKAVKLCTEVFEPINDQMGKTIKKASDSMAA